MTSSNGRQVFRRPLVAFDGSSHAEAALARATEMVQASHGRLSIITVVPEPSLWALSGTYWAPLDFGVIGREVERGYQSLLDVSHYVLERSPVPVLVVHLSAIDDGVGRWTVMPRTTNGALAYAQGSSHA
jgi:nucleotide-binding universal stress UspA family protein